MGPITVTILVLVSTPSSPHVAEHLDQGLHSVGGGSQDSVVQVSGSGGTG